ncbi:hypothetical protein SAMN04487949_1398 [Halogranum gelatinilyticum]|uniref:Uncharacterized protein n=1 Tax=Halogranum gelatinilyticum TaxID=660521 RepID=A0A1G9SK86_9EURY|nr:hypothetical protein SAMN04487949_1398 [Halogranum gelatinilyticum]
MTGYYDYVLGVIPLALLGITAALSIVGLPLTVAVPAGASVAGLVVGHALFVNGPATAAPQPTATPQPTQSPPVNAD